MIFENAGSGHAKKQLPASPVKQRALFMHCSKREYICSSRHRSDRRPVLHLLRSIISTIRSTDALPIPTHSGSRSSRSDIDSEFFILP